MSFIISTGLQGHLMATADLKSALDGTVIKIYGDAVSQAAANALIPATADAAIGSATLLSTISVGGAGTGITFEGTPVNGAIVKTAAETWLGTNGNSGYAAFYRIELASDTGALSTTAIRAQGTVGQLNTDLIIAAAYMTSGQEQRIDSYVIGIPTA